MAASMLRGTVGFAVGWLAALAIVSLCAGTPVRAQCQQTGATSPGRDRSGAVRPTNADADRAMRDHARRVREAMAEALKPAAEAHKCARKLMDEGDLARAEEECRHAVDISVRAVGTPVSGGALTTLGDIMLLQGRPRAALDAYLTCRVSSGGLLVTLGIVIARCRLHDYAGAAAEYTDPEISALWRGSPYSSVDLPGTSTLAAVEASALLARAIKYSSNAREARALADCLAAQRLCPTSARVALRCAETLRSVKRYDEAVTQYRRAALYGHGAVAEEARRLGEGLAANMRHVDQIARERTARQAGADAQAP